MPLLVRTPAPYSTESLIGYVLRLSERNGYNSPRHIACVLGLDATTFSPANLPVGKLARALGRDEKELRSISYRRESGGGEVEGARQYKVLNHDLMPQKVESNLREGILRLKNPAFCPLCVEDIGYVDAFWDLSIAVACHRHGCTVLRRCNSCGDSLQWLRQGLLTCHCGARLTRDACEPADHSTAALMAYIEARLHQRRTPDNNCGFPIDQLDKLSFGSLIQVLSALGRHGSKGQGPADAAKDSTGKVVAAALRDWPNGYHELLARIGRQQVSSNSNSVGLIAQFEEFYSSMFKNRLFSKDAAFLLDEFLAFGGKRWGHALASRCGVKESRFVSKTEYARRFGLTARQVHQLVTDGFLVTKSVPQKRAARVIIDLEQSADPKTSNAEITNEKAAEILGLPEAVLRNLRSRVLIDTKCRVGEELWHRSDVLALQARGSALSDDRALVHEPPSLDNSHGATRTVALGSLLGSRYRSVACKADIVAAVLDGTIEVIRGGENWGGLCVSRDAVKVLLRERRVIARGPTCSMNQIVAQTGLDADVVTTAVELGILVGRVTAGCLRVSASAIVRFNTEYVPLVQLAKRLGAKTVHLCQQCQRSGISLITVDRDGRKRRGRAQPLLPRRWETMLTQAWQATAKAKAREAGTVGAKAVENYLQQLRANDDLLPRRAGKPNYPKISRACGISRLALSRPPLRQLLDEFESAERERLGVKSLAPLDLLDSYLRDIEEKGVRLPRHQDGRPNLSAIARACGIARNLFDQNPALSRRLADASEPIAQESQHESPVTAEQWKEAA